MMTTWTPTRNSKGTGFQRTTEALEFWNMMQEVAPGWTGSWSLVPDKTSQPNAIHCGPARLLAFDLLSDFTVLKDGLLIAPGTFLDRRRRKKSWDGTDSISLDLDDGAEPEDVIATFPGIGMLLHSSYNDWRGKQGKPACSRFRAYLFFRQRLTDPADYSFMWGWVADLLRSRGVIVDASAKDVTRVMYSVRDGSARPPERNGHPPQWIAAVPGEALDVEKLPGGDSLSAMRQQALEAAEKARYDARRALSKAASSTPDNLRRAAEWRFKGALDKLILNRQPGTGRNTGVFACAAILGRYVASGLVSNPASFKENIRDAARASGLTNDIERQINNGFEKGQANPLHLGGGSQ